LGRLRRTPDRKTLHCWMGISHFRALLRTSRICNYQSLLSPTQFTTRSSILGSNSREKNLMGIV